LVRGAGEEPLGEVRFRVLWAVLASWVGGWVGGLSRLVFGSRLGAGVGVRNDAGGMRLLENVLIVSVHSSLLSVPWDFFEIPCFDACVHMRSYPLRGRASQAHKLVEKAYKIG